MLCRLLAHAIKKTCARSPGRLRIALVRGHRNGAPPGAPAGGESFIPTPSKIPDRTEPRVYRVRSHAKLVEVRLARHDSARLLQRLHHRRVERAGVLVQDAGGACRRQLARADVVFNCDQSTIYSRLWVSCPIAHGVSIIVLMKRK